MILSLLLSATAVTHAAPSYADTSAEICITDTITQTENDYRDPADTDPFRPETQNPTPEPDIYTVDGHLYIETDHPDADIEVYSLLGQLIASRRATSRTTVIDVERGVIIVKVNGIARKLVVK